MGDLRVDRERGRGGEGVEGRVGSEIRKSEKET